MPSASLPLTADALTSRTCHHLLPMALMAALLLGSPQVATAEDDVISSPKVQRVALFKNGLAFVTSQITLPPDVRSVGLGNLPDPIHGTLWLEHDGSTPLLGIASRNHTTTETQPVQSIADLLAANVGRRVTLMPGSLTGDVQLASESLALLRTAEGTVAVHPDHLERVLVLGQSVASQTSIETEQSMLHLELERPSPGSKVAISYLTRGLAWSPSYQINLEHEARATISGKAILVNEALDLEATAMDLVTGFPHVLFGHVTSPIAPQQDLDGFLSALRQRQGAPSGNQRILMQSVSNALTSATQLGDPFPDEERSTEDLFFYPIPEVSLGRGETLAMPFLEASVPYEHVYTWDIPDELARERRGYGNDPSDDEEEVWHVCRFTNTTDMPLTTAPAQFVKGGRLVGQDMMRYTPVGATTSIRINRALGISAERLEVETDRQPLEERLYGDYYDRISVRGELRLTNGLGKSVQIEITKSLTGEVGNAAGSPKLINTTRGLREVNPTHQLQWTLDLAAGSAVALNYKYSLLVRR